MGLRAGRRIPLPQCIVADVIENILLAVFEYLIERYRYLAGDGTKYR